MARCVRRAGDFQLRNLFRQEAENSYCAYAALACAICTALDLQTARAGVSRDENNLFDDFDGFGDARGFW
jgi:hypothetical protein